MNQTEKQRFIRNLTDSVKKELIGKVAQMPEEWDGIELRELIAEKFDYECLMTRSGENKARFRKRLKEYRNEVLVRNL